MTGSEPEVELEYYDDTVCSELELEVSAPGSDSKEENIENQENDSPMRIWNLYHEKCQMCSHTIRDMMYWIWLDGALRILEDTGNTGLKVGYLL